MRTIPNSKQFNNDFAQGGSLNDSDLSYTYLYESIDSQSMKKLQDLNVINNGLASPEYISNYNQYNNIKQPISDGSEFTYIYESISDLPDFNYRDKSDYTYVYTYGEYDDDQWTNEYTYTYDEPSASQINLFENQQINKLNKALNTRNVLLDPNINNNSPTNKNLSNLNSPNLTISNQPPIFIQRTPKRIITNNQNQQRKKTSPKPIKKQQEKYKKLSPHKKSILRKINLLEEQLKYLESSATTANEISSTELTESETKDDPKIKHLQHKLSQITGKNIYNPRDSYSPGNSQYTYTYAYEDTYEKDDEIEKYHSKSKQKSKAKPRSKSTKNKPKNLDQISPKISLDIPTPKTPTLVLQTLNDKAISIFNDNNNNNEHSPKNKVDLQISSSIRSEQVLKPEKNEEIEQPHSNSASIESIHDDNKIEIKERSTKLENDQNKEKHEKTIKKILRKIKVNKPISRNSKKVDNDPNISQRVLRNSPKPRSLLTIQDDDELNESEFAALNPVDAKKYTSTHSIDFKGKAKPNENNDTIKIKIVEDANVPDVDRFCVFYIEGNEDSVKKTKTIHKGQNSYNENFEFQLNELVASKLVIFLKKQDLIKEDKIMGTTKIDLQKVPQNSTLSKWVPLKSYSGVKIESKIHLVLKRETKITEKDDIFVEEREIDSTNHHHKSNHHRSQKRNHKGPKLEKKVETKEAEAQVSLLSESYSDEELINEENSQISNHDEEKQPSNLSENSYESNHEDEFPEPNNQKERQISNLKENSYSSNHEEESPKLNNQKKREVSKLSNNSYKSNHEEEFPKPNKQKEKKTPNLSEYSNDSNYEYESPKSNKQKEKKTPNLSEYSNDSNYEYESPKSNKQKEKKASNLSEYSNYSNYEYEPPKSNKQKEEKAPNLNDYSDESNYESEPPKSNEQKERKISNHDEYSYNSGQYESDNQKEKQVQILDENLSNSNSEEKSHNSFEEEESAHEEKSQKSKSDEESQKTKSDEESQKSKSEEESQNQSQEESSQSKIDNYPIESSLTSFLSYSDALRSEKIRAVGRVNFSHNSASFDTEVSGLKIQSENSIQKGSSNFQTDDSESDLSSVRSDFVSGEYNELNNQNLSLSSGEFKSRDVKNYQSSDHKNNTQSRFAQIRNNNESEGQNGNHSSSFASNVSESPELSDGSISSEDNNSRRRKNRGENDSESGRNNSSTYQSDTFNDLVLNQLFKEDKTHNFDSSFSDYNSSLQFSTKKKTKSSRKSHSSSRNITVNETNRKRKLNDSLEMTPGEISDDNSSPRRRNSSKDRDGAYLSASGSNSSRNQIKKLSSLSDSDNLSENLNNEALRISIISQNSKTPKNIPDWQDLSSEDDSLNLNNSNLVNSKISGDDSLASSSSKKRRSHRSSKSSNGSRNSANVQKTTTTTYNNYSNNNYNSQNYSLRNSRSTTPKPVIYWTVEYSSSTAPPNYK